MNRVVQNRGWVAALAVALLVSPVATAQNALVKTTRVVKGAAPIELKGKDLESFRMYPLADAVRYFSGTQFKDFGNMGGITSLNVRSLGSDRMGVFYNGIEVGNTVNGQVDLSKFSLDNVGNLSIYSGQKGDIFQAARDFASSNSIYITTQRPLFQREESSMNFRSQLRLGSNWMVNPSISIENDLGHYVYSTLNVEVMAARNIYPFSYQRQDVSGNALEPYKGKRSNSQLNAVRVEAALHGTIATEAVQSGTWNVFAYHYNDERGIPGQIINYKLYDGERLRERNSFVQSTTRLDINDWYRTQIMLKIASDYTHYSNLQDKLALTDEVFRQYGAYLSSSHQFTLLEGWRASLAYDLQFDMLRKTDALTNTQPKGFSRPRRLVNLLAVASQYQIGGLSLQASALGTYVYNMASKGFDAGKNEMGISPSFLVYYQPFKRVDFFIQAYAKQTYRVPNYSDRYISRLIGEELKPERQRQADFGLGYSRKSHDFVSDFGLNADGYYQMVYNKIVAYPRGQLYRWTMTNLGKVQVYGGNASAYVTFAFPGKFLVTSKVQYTYEKSLDVTDVNDNYYKNQIPNVPVHSGSAIVRLSWSGWELNYSFLYAGTRYSEQENIPYNEMQPWYTHDISLSKLFKVGEWRFRAMAEVNNMIGDAFEIVTDYPMPKQTVRLTLTTELQ